MDAFAQLFAAVVATLTGGSVAVMVGLLCWDAVVDAQRMSRSFGMAPARPASLPGFKAAAGNSWIAAGEAA